MHDDILALDYLAVASGLSPLPADVRSFLASRSRRSSGTENCVSADCAAWTGRKLGVSVRTAPQELLVFLGRHPVAEVRAGFWVVVNGWGFPKS